MGVRYKLLKASLLKRVIEPWVIEPSAEHELQMADDPITR